MKSKTLNKKLTLNKATVTNLADIDLSGAKGGALPETFRTFCIICTDLCEPETVDLRICKNSEMTGCPIFCPVY